MVHNVGGTTTTTDYAGNVIYENGVQKKLLTEEGYVDLTSGTYYYYLKDHQGNNRVVVNSGGTVTETNHYYPFGGTFASGTVQPYKYNGKELDTKAGLNWYDYGARHYDAVLGRFTTQDPLAEKYYKLSPYTFTGNHGFNARELGGGLFIFVNGFFPMEYLGHYAYHTQRNSSSPYHPVPIYNPNRNYRRIDFYGWGNVDKLYMNQYNDNHSLYVNGSFDLTSSASGRYNRGVESGEELLSKLRSGELELSKQETIKIVGYSMGGAYAAGIAYALMHDSEYSNRLQFVDYLAPFQPTDFKHPKGVLGRQFVSNRDKIAANNKIVNVNLYRADDFGDISNLWGHSLSDEFCQFIKQCFNSGIPIYLE